MVEKQNSTPRKFERLRTIDDATVLDGGEAVGFTIKTASGKELPVSCALAELGDVFSYLGQLAKAAGEMRGVNPPPPSEAHNYLAPIPAQGMGLQLGSDADETLIVVRLSGFDLAFSVPSNGLARLADDLGRILRTLSPGGDQIH